MYDKLMDRIKAISRMLDLDVNYGRPYVVKFIINNFSQEEGRDIILSLYRRNWK